MNNINEIIAKELNVKQFQVENTIKLIDESLPF